MLSARPPRKAAKIRLGPWSRHRPLRPPPDDVRVATILFCDDERSICEMLDISLRREGHRVETVQAGQTAKNKIDGALYDVIITDIKMPNIDGIEVLRHAHRVSPDSAVILITAVDDYEAAVEAVKAGGASDGDSAVRMHYDEGYYAAFIRDPDGNRIEAVRFLRSRV